MRPIGYIIGLAAMAGTGMLAYNDYSNNPVTAVRTAHLEAVEDVTSNEESLIFVRDLDYEMLEEAIVGKETLWKELIPPPPPPPPPPPKTVKLVAPTPPDLDDYLEHVRVTRQRMGVGDKAKMRFEIKGKREWHKVGDVINGLKIVSIDKEKVVFSKQWMGKELTTSLRIR